MVDRPLRFCEGLTKWVSCNKPPDRKIWCTFEFCCFWQSYSLSQFSKLKMKWKWMLLHFDMMAAAYCLIAAEGPWGAPFDRGPPGYKPATPQHVGAMRCSALLHLSLQCIIASIVAVHHCMYRYICTLSSTLNSRIGASFLGDLLTIVRSSVCDPSYLFMMWLANLCSVCYSLPALHCQPLLMKIKYVLRGYWIEKGGLWPVTSIYCLWRHYTSLAAWGRLQLGVVHWVT